MKLPPFLVYSVLRLLAFLVPLGILLVFPIFQTYWPLAVLFAALIGLSLSVLFLRKPLAAASSRLEERRRRNAADIPDEAAEDAEDGEPGDPAPR